MRDFRTVLESIGYSLTEDGKHYRTRPLYRDSDNNTVLSINKENGHWFDFKTNENGSFEKLIEKTMQLPSGQAGDWLGQKNFSPAIENAPKSILIEDSIFDEKILDELEGDHSYWVNRKISEESIKVFKGGVCKSGKMKNRYVFPIFNSFNKIIGVSGRLISAGSANAPKWKHLGQKKSWTFPSHCNLDFIQKDNHVIIVESIGDMLALWDNGIKTSIVSFGLDIQPGLLNFLLKIDVKKIIIAFNNDSFNNMAGNLAADKQYKKLLKYFDKNQVSISLPEEGKDFGEMTSEQIKKWKITTKNICLHQG